MPLSSICLRSKSTKKLACFVTGPLTFPPKFCVRKSGVTVKNGLREFKTPSLTV